MGIIHITVTTKKILLHEDKVWEVRSRKENKGCWYFSIKFSLKVLPYYQKKKRFSRHTMMPLFIKFPELFPGLYVLSIRPVIKICFVFLDLAGSTTFYMALRFLDIRP